MEATRFGYRQRLHPRETLAGDTWGLVRQRARVLLFTLAFGLSAGKRMACLGCRGKAPPVVVDY